MRGGFLVVRIARFPGAQALARFRFRSRARPGARSFAAPARGAADGLSRKSAAHGARARGQAEGNQARDHPRARHHGKVRIAHAPPRSLRPPQRDRATHGQGRALCRAARRPRRRQGKEFAAMSALDPRTTPARADLVAAYLRGKVKADRFAEGIVHRVVEASAPLRHAPAPDAMLDSEVLHGEEVTIYETSDEGWCWGQTERDNYVGYLPVSALPRGATGAAHRSAASRAFFFRAPDNRAPPTTALSFASRVKIMRNEKDFGITADGGF